MRRSIILFAAFFLAGCGGAEKAAAPAPSSPAPAAGVSWMDSFCGSLIDFAKIGEFTMPDFEQGDVVSARKVMDEAFGVFAPGFDNAVTGLGKLSQAPSAEAEATRKGIVDALTPIRDEVLAAKAALDAAPKDDKQAVVAAAASFRQIGSRMNDLPDPFQQLETNVSLKTLAAQAPELREAAFLTVLSATLICIAPRYRYRRGPAGKSSGREVFSCGRGSPSLPR